jgi:phage-related protein
VHQTDGDQISRMIGSFQVWEQICEVATTNFGLDMVYHIWYTMCMNDSLKILPARFFKTASGTEPVREWLKDLDKDDSRIIGGDIRTVEYGWPIGMPVCRSIKGYRDLWEVRSHISDGRIARVIFHMSGGEMILLHGFIKKTQQTPHQDLELADRRRKEYESHV